jgi:NADPH2:quinone reductase
MRALFFDPEPPHRLRVGDARDPVPRDSEALIDTGAVSLNFGELPFRTPAALLARSVRGKAVLDVTS